jgi:hypothetical protein
MLFGPGSKGLVGKVYDFVFYDFWKFVYRVLERILGKRIALFIYNTYDYFAHKANPSIQVRA